MKRKTSQEMILKIGATIEYANEQKAVVESIRIISTGKFVEQCEYDGEDEDIILTLKDELGTIKLWLKDNPVHIL